MWSIPAQPSRDRGVQRETWSTKKMKDKSDTSSNWINPLFVTSDGAEKWSESLLLGEKLRRRANDGWALGTFLIEVPTAATVTALSLAEFDFVVLDMEHSSIGFSCLQTLISAGQAAGITTLVRPCGEDSGIIGKVLDMGAHGIMMPHVDSPERAREIVNQSRYKPLGSRGFSPLTRFDAFKEPLKSLGDASYVVVQIEGKEALKRVKEIASVPGIDAVFIGPYDLALSLGVSPGSPEVHRAAREMARQVPAEIALGIYIDDPDTCGEWAEQRFALQCVGFDGRMLSDGARQVSGAARSGMSRVGGKS